jgi:hypothetical protein
MTVLLSFLRLYTYQKSLPEVDFLVTCLKEANPYQLFTSELLQITVETQTKHSGK